MLSSQDGENLFNEFKIRKTKNPTYKNIGLLQFLEFCKERVDLEVNDRKVLHKKYLVGLDAMINETTTRNKKFTKNELKSIRDKLPVSNNDMKNQNYKSVQISYQAYSDYNLSHEPPSIELKSLNYKQKRWAESILIRWQIVLNKFLFGKFHLHGPEHPTQCSYKRKKLYHRPPFTEWPKNLQEAVNLFEKPEDEHFDANDSVLETVVIIQNDEDEPIYIPNDKHNLLSPDMTNESKRLNKPQGGDYNKLCRMLNDAANSFILYWAKKCKRVTKELKKLFCDIRWIGLFSSDGKLCFMIYQICEETKIHFITYLNSYPILIPITNMNHDMASTLEVFLQIEDIFQMNLKVIEKIQKIASQINIKESENYETPLEYLKKVIGKTPSTPHK
ncbi:5984_t:CDS:2 [Dentiscutata erythropus]|uniref:5984_t:CDS:1 n=1 Tax=Dentiscutata erythropus TaxID=1348616 RepID=A0A9N9CZ92_9GLOM|nr:5984_t:CDS:2 [Dentiscutata erythropus]